MKNFKNDFLYDKDMDEEVIPLCNAMNSLNGIETFESCCGHSCDSFRIWFKVTDPIGLFFLTRCVDHRYWKYGYLWKIELTVGDSMFKDGSLPITYMLNSGPIVGEDAYKQATDLLKNMDNHLNHKAFMEDYNLGNILK